MSSPENSSSDEVVSRPGASAAIMVLLAIVVAIVVTVIVWRMLREPEAEPNVPAPVSPAEFAPAVEQAPEVRFVDITESAGIHFRHSNGATGRKLLPETMGGGCAFIDFDRDGDQDLVFVNSSPWPSESESESESDSGTSGATGVKATQALYENDGGGQFRDVSAEKGLDVSFYGMGAAIGDVDGDGWDDIFFTAVGGDRLFRNDEGKRFVEVTREVGIPDDGPHAWSTSAAFLDYDGDGRLDLFVCRYVEWSPEIDLSQAFQITGIGRAYGPPQNFAGAFCRLYRNTGGRFEDASAKAGVEVRNPLTKKAMAKALGVAVHDMDRDGYPDIVVANDTVQNFLFHNKGDGTFEELGVSSGIAFDPMGNTRGAMGIDWAVLDGAGTQAVVVGNFANEVTALYMSENPSALPFSDDAVATGIGNPSRRYMKFGVFFFDFDLDGRLDIFEANGHLEADIESVQASQSYEQPPQLFWNAGPNAQRLYEELGEGQVGADLFRPVVGRGCAYGDIDGDGDLDMVIVPNNGAARLIRNDGGDRRGWIRLALEGRSPNTNAFGARVEARVGERTVHAALTSGRSYLSQCEQVVTIGLGGASHADDVRIWWPRATKPQSLGRIEARTFRKVVQE